MLQRRKSRILAMSMLYALDVQRSDKLSDALEILTIFSRPFKKAVINYATFLTKGVLVNADAIDAIMFRHTFNWAQKRLSMVDRQIMRLSIYEFAIKKSVPAVVSINEAVTIAKIYGCEDSGHFVNGILDAVNIDINNLPKPETAVTLPEEEEFSEPESEKEIKRSSSKGNSTAYLKEFASRAASERKAHDAEIAAREAAREAEWKRLQEERAAERAARIAEREKERELRAHEENF